MAFSRSCPLAIVLKFFEKGMYSVGVLRCCCFSCTVNGGGSQWICSLRCVALGQTFILLTSFLPCCLLSSTDTDFAAPQTHTHQQSHVFFPLRKALWSSACSRLDPALNGVKCSLRTFPQSKFQPRSSGAPSRILSNSQKCFVSLSLKSQTSW